MIQALALQYLLVGLAVVVSLVFVLRRQFPQASRRGRLAIAATLIRPGRARWQQRLGRWLAPAAQPRPNPGACGGCNGCDSPHG